jgi:hypothetical protein
MEGKMKIQEEPKQESGYMVAGMARFTAFVSDREVTGTMQEFDCNRTEAVRRLTAPGYVELQHVEAIGRTYVARWAA